MDTLKELFAQNYEWFWDLTLILGLTLLAGFIWRMIRKRLIRLVASTRNNWDDVVVGAVAVPVNWMILVVGLTWAADITAGYFSPDELHSISVIRQLALVILTAWAMWRLINRIEEKQLYTGGFDPTTVQLVGKLAKLAVTILMILPVFQMLGISVSGILAFGGMGGLIVGLAAKDLLANFFGSLIIYLDKPFRVGDWIRSPDRNIEGTVESIGFRVTRIRTFDKRPLYVPNQVFTAIAVENPSRMLNRRIYETIGVRYQDARLIGELMDKVRDMLRQHPEIDQDQTLIVNFNGFGASSLDFFIYTFTRTTDWVHYHGVKQDVLLKIMAIIHECGADCAFPTRTLHIDSLPPQVQSAATAARS
ncbi:MAG: mechanosensitive ion channel protein MscS [Oceanospirillaceae bacterium]|nr:mechanosensitive ion channel protein MscS [Oceanospirillaceae bacterium]|tara:strand:- start:6485 stop:7573 length:1089 start_codon:yes stop_codon:yes gene_type:complete